jgi:hypothetical protein
MTTPRAWAKPRNHVMNASRPTISTSTHQGNQNDSMPHVVKGYADRSTRNSGISMAELEQRTRIGSTDPK